MAKKRSEEKAKVSHEWNFAAGEAWHTLLPTHLEGLASPTNSDYRIKSSLPSNALSV